MLQEWAHDLRRSVDTHYIRSVLLYIGLYALEASLALPFSIILTLAGGFLFGVWYGTLFAALAATLGATICFLVVRYVLGDALKKRYEQQFLSVKKELDERGVYYLLSIRFLAVIPFSLVNITLALLPISLGTFVVTTFFGILPGALVFTYAGQSLLTLSSPSDILSGKILGAFFLLAVLALVPVLLEKLFKQ